MEQRRRKRLSVAVSFQERTYVEEEHDDEEGVGQKENVPPKPRNAKPNVSFDRKKSIVQFKENDDAVEKRNRRKSRIMMEEALGGSPLSPQKGKAAPPRQSLAAGGGGLLRRKSLLPRIHLPKTQLIELYSECIRLSAENKINQKNSWSLDLIDHIDDVLQSNFNSEEGSGVGNFQAASCTLDASVKIYSYRVDSIHNETYRVLGDLSLTRNGKKSKHDDADEGADEEGNESQAQGKKGAGARRKRRTRVDTIEKNPASLLVEELGFGLGLDPLFRKLSSGFDENGAQGLLLNQLPINRHAEVVLDSTATFMSSNDVDSAEDEGGEGGSSAHGLYSLPADLVRSLQRSLRDAAVLCPPLSEQQPDEADDQEEFEPVAFELDASEADAQTNTHDNPSEGEGLLRTLGLHSLAPTAPDLADHDPNAWGDDDIGYDGAEASLDDSQIGSDAFHSNPPLTTQERIAGDLGDLGAGMKGLRDGGGGGALASDLASLVGTLQLGASGWAGPSHWKYKPAKAVVVRAKTETGQEENGEEEEEEEEEERASANKKGKKKAAFFIDFSAPPIDTKVAFATTRAATTLSQAVLKKAKEEDYLLPRDVKYDYRALCSYFLHPTRTIGSPLVSSALLGGAALYSNIAANQPFDVPAPATHEDVNMDVDTDMDLDIGGSDMDDAEENYVAETDLHSANDDPATHAQDAAAAGEVGEDKLELVEQPRKINSEAISYARVAKKIDVIALKRALSHQITSSSAQPQEKEGVSFKSLLHKLPSRIKDKRTLEDLSVQVCFITLLHLANEHDFEISAASLGGLNDDDDDEDDGDSLAYPTDYLVHVPERQ